MGVTIEYDTAKELHAIAERFGSIDTVSQAAPKRNGQLVGERAFIMAANRLPNPSPKYTIAERYEGTYMPEIIGIGLSPDSAYQTLMHCLDCLKNEVQMEI
ncbi:MAG: hypothetical protein AB1793_08070 [Candidatus Thermoplasmatota archaeon]